KCYHCDTTWARGKPLVMKAPSITGDSIPVRQQMTGVINPKGIIYIFEISLDLPSNLVKMKNLKLFDTTIDEWSSMDAVGADVDPRWIFSSVLNGRIIIFGGCTFNNTGVSPKLAVLDTNKNPYEWSIPSSSNVNSPPSIYGHTANLYYNYMIITFGYDIDNETYNSQVYLYDIKNNAWVTHFDPPSSRNLLLIGLVTGI
ncbi:6684_t:CDS:2, partial [Dentiscutata erythropus]